MVVLSFISLQCINGIERTILTNRTFVTIYVLRTLHEKLISENNRFKSVLISLSKKKKKKSSETKKRHDRVLEVSFKRVRNLLFKLFHSSKLSSSTNHGDQHFWRLWATFQKFVARPLRRLKKYFYISGKSLQSLKIKNVLYFFSHFLFVDRKSFKHKRKRKNSFSYFPL